VLGYFVLKNNLKIKTKQKIEV